MRRISTLFIFSIVSTFFLTSCLAPRKSRQSLSQNVVSGEPFGINRSGGDSGSSDGSEVDDTSDNNSGGSDNTEVPQEIAHCGFSETNFKSYHRHIGNFTLCQSATTDTEVFIQVQNPINDVKLCLVPTFHSGSRSIYIGEAKCLFIPDGKKVYKLTFHKNRPGNYSSYPVTGSMIMKDKSFFYPAPFSNDFGVRGSGANRLTPDAFFECSFMLDNYSDPSWCEAYNQVGEYVYHQF